MSACWSPERAKLARRVAPAFCPEYDAGGEVEVSVVEDGERECLTARADCDAPAALVRGLAQYLAALELSHRGRDVSLRTVVEEWPDVQDQDRGGFPAACVQVVDLGQYNGSQQQAVKPFPDADQASTEVVSLVLTGHYKATLAVDVWATEKEERIGVCKALEAAFFPRDRVTRLVLKLPFAFGQHVGYTLVSGGPTGDPAQVSMGIRSAQFRVVGEIRTGYVRSYPRAKQVWPRGSVA